MRGRSELKGDTAYRIRFSLPLLGNPGVWMQNAGWMNLLTIGVGLVILLGVAERVAQGSGRLV